MQTLKSSLKENANKLQVYPASYSQTSMYLTYMMAPESVGYNVMFATLTKSKLDVGALEKAVNYLVSKHTSLRTLFMEAGSKVYQRIASEDTYLFQTFDASQFTDIELQDALEQFGHIPYNLQKGPLFRVGVFSKKDDEHYIVIGMHHITCDAGSFETIFKELQFFYECARQNIAPDISATSSYNSFVKWEQQWLKSDSALKARAFWKQQLAISPPRIDLKKIAKAGDEVNDFIPARANNFNFDGGEHFYKFDQELTKKLKNFAKNEKVTLYNVLLSVYFLLLHKLTNIDDIAVGSYANLRHQHEFENQVGYYLNTIVLRAGVSPDQNFREFLHQTKHTVIQALSHQYYPFVLLAEELNPQREVGRQLWFDHIFNWTTGDSYEMSNSFFMDLSSPEKAAQSLPMQPWKIKRRTAPFDLALNMGEVNNEIVSSILYNSSLFNDESVANFMHRYKLFLQQIAENPDQFIKDLSLIDSEEAKIILGDWTDNASAYDKQLTMHEAFLKQAEMSPDSVAVIWKDQAHTYAQLDHFSMQVAQALTDSGVREGMSVGICIERSPNLIVGLLAILRIGANYVPLDPSYPNKRNDYMLQDSEAVLLLSSSEVQETYSPKNIKTILLNKDNTTTILHEDQAIDPQKIKNNNTAYLIYTSGSTGDPKGAKISHQNCSALFHWADLTFCHEEINTVLASTSICFDISVFEIFYPLCRGGSIVLIQDLLHLPEDENKERISLINTVPSVIATLLDYDGLPSNVNVITLVGEPLRRSLVDKLYACENVKKVYNLYGPTEDTVFSTSLLVPRNETKEPSIGRAIPNTHTYILDKDLNPLPPYIPGELYLGGDGVSLGYHSRETLNKERFLEDPFRMGSHQKVYRTGDIAFYCPNGDIEFLGRSDNQVKIRGYRVELGEIENALNQLENISEAIVSAINVDDRSEKELVAYLVSDSIEFFGEACRFDSALQKKISIELEASIPNHLIPTHFIFVKEMPKTLNGKIDRKKLESTIAIVKPQPKENAEEGMNDTQTVIANIWAEVLGIDSRTIGVYDKFYDLGGSSLRLVQIIKLIQERLSKKVSIADLFRFQNIYSISQWLEDGENASSEILNAGIKKGSMKRMILQNRTKRKQTVAY
ncbi:MAG: amino acid adenylation domain-containing protein [Alphaproteobacteria bacterium]|nr:amino acid adenylation domain-containing protein [Alphaproteobacteria bacterium]